jgi:opacity protein-like surface antigen
MRFRCLVAASALVLVPSVASAEECPEGEWFCEDGGAASAPADAPREYEAAPAEAPAAGAPGEKEGPPVVVYTPKGAPKPSRVIVVERTEPKPPKPRRIQEWGFNLHLTAALLGDDPKADDDAGMGGIGFAFRYRPVRMFAIEGGLELIGGTDWNGFERDETAFLANAIVFFNPEDKFQVYWLGGFGGSRAHVQVEEDTGSFEEQYSYFGVQTGIGVEARVSKKVAIGADLIGFLRGRTDVRAHSRPEFVDPETHQATNSSGGGLLRGGVTFYW